MNKKTDPIRVAVLVSGGGTNLQALIDAGEAGRLPHARIAAVISSNADAYALRARAAAAYPRTRSAAGTAPTRLSLSAAYAPYSRSAARS